MGELLLGNPGTAREVLPERWMMPGLAPGERLSSAVRLFSTAPMDNRDSHQSRAFVFGLKIQMAKKLARTLAGKIPYVARILDERDDLRRRVDSLDRANADMRAQLAKMTSELQLASSERDRFRTGFAPGHYYSSVPDLREIRARDSALFGQMPDTIPGVELNRDEQEALLHALARFYPEMPFRSERQDGLRYYFENPNFSYCDATVLYGMIRQVQPKRIIEVGCGFSSCVSLDTNERFFENRIRCTFIDPYPQLLQALLKPGDESRIEILQDCVQDVPVSTFAELQENDILFIDSSHVLKTGGDLNYILFQILPSLRAGVYVHFHDTPFPFEYPREWVYAGRAWNESYALRAFLQYNAAFRIVYFNTYLMSRHRSFFEQHMPLCLRNEGGSLWLRKVQGASLNGTAAVIPSPAFTPVHRFDAVYIDHPQQLGPGWYGSDDDLAGRWMTASAEVRLRGPDRKGQRLLLSGYQPNPAGVTLHISADGTRIGDIPIPEGRFNVEHPLPDELVGRPRMNLRLQLDKPYHAPNDDRELGLSFGIIEIR